jgi:hypothetical protein
MGHNVYEFIGWKCDRYYCVLYLVSQMIPSVTTINNGVCNMSHSTMHKIMLLVTVKWWYHTKRPILSDLLCVPI